MGPNRAIEVCWDRFARSLPAGSHVPAKDFKAFAFGHGELDAGVLDDLTKRVAGGVTPATWSLLSSYRAKEDRHVQPVDVRIVATAARRARCVIETSELRLEPFNEVDVTFAAAYGEGNGTLASRRSVVAANYAGMIETFEIRFSDATPMMPERFRDVERCRVD